MLPGHIHGRGLKMMGQCGILHISRGTVSRFCIIFTSAFYKVQQGFYQDVLLNDSYPVDQIFSGSLLFSCRTYLLLFTYSLNPGTPLSTNILTIHFRQGWSNSMPALHHLSLENFQTNWTSSMEIDRKGIRRLEASGVKLKIDAVWED
jgi:hypothetical protein